jgi:hypothetical protein
MLDGRLKEGQPLIVGTANSSDRNGFFGIRFGF